MTVCTDTLVLGKWGGEDRIAGGLLTSRCKKKKKPPVRSGFSERAVSGDKVEGIEQRLALTLWPPSSHVPACIRKLAHIHRVHAHTKKKLQASLNYIAILRTCFLILLLVVVVVCFLVLRPSLTVYPRPASRLLQPSQPSILSPGIIGMCH